METTVKTFRRIETTVTYTQADLVKALKLPKNAVLYIPGPVDKIVDGERMEMDHDFTLYMQVVDIEED